MDKRIHQVRLAEWSQRIIDRKNSGLTIAQWCELNGFTKDIYHYWQKRVRTAALESAGAAGMGSCLSSNSNTLDDPSGIASHFAELPQPSGVKAIRNPASTRGNVSVGGRIATVTIQRGSTVIELTNDADERLLSFVGEVIRNAE